MAPFEQTAGPPMPASAATSRTKRGGRAVTITTRTPAAVTSSKIFIVRRETVLSDRSRVPSKSTAAARSTPEDNRRPAGLAWSGPGSRAFGEAFMTTLTDRPKTALVVIDVQNGVVAGSHERDRVVANIATLVD